MTRARWAPTQGVSVTEGLSKQLAVVVFGAAQTVDNNVQCQWATRKL